MVVQFLALAAAIPLLAAPLMMVVAFFAFAEALVEAIEELIQALFVMVAIVMGVAVVFVVCMVFVTYFNMNRQKKKEKGTRKIYRRQQNQKHVDDFTKKNPSSCVNNSARETRDGFDCLPLSSLEVMMPPGSFLPVPCLSSITGSATKLDHRDWMHPAHESSQPTKAQALPPPINPSYTPTFIHRRGKREKIMQTENVDDIEDFLPLHDDETQSQSRTVGRNFKQSIRWILLIRAPFILYCIFLEVMIHNDFQFKKQPTRKKGSRTKMTSSNNVAAKKESIFNTDSEDSPSSSYSFETIEDWLNSEWIWSYVSYSYEVIDSFIQETYMEDYDNILLGIQAYV